MIVGGVFFCLFFISSLAIHFPRSRNLDRLYIHPGDPHPLRLNKDVEFANQPYNAMMRRGQKHPQKVRNIENYLNSHNDDNLKSLELDDSLERYLAIDAQKRKLKKQKLGLKVVDVDDFVIDRSKKGGNEKLKLIQSLNPPEHFFKKFITPKVRKQERINPKVNKGYKGLGYKVVNVNDFDHDRMIKKKVKLIQSLDPPKKFFKRYGPDNTKLDESNWKIPQALVKKIWNRRKPIKSLFDENGMLYLTKPKRSRGTKLNALLNKVFEFGNRNQLRQPTKQFTKDELDQIQIIAISIDEEYDDRGEFNQQMWEEKQLQQDVSESSDELMKNSDRVIDLIAKQPLSKKKLIAPDYYQKNYVAQLISKVVQQNLEQNQIAADQRSDGLVKDLTKLLLLDMTDEPKSVRQGDKNAIQDAQNTPVENLEFDFDELVA